MDALVIVIVIVVLLAVGLWAAYNSLVKKRNRTQEAWCEIDVELKRRHDPIPNLVSTVQGYATHEQGTFEAVTRARASAITAGATGDPDQIAPAENALSGALRSLFAVAENYPQLRAVLRKHAGTPARAGRSGRGRPAHRRASFNPGRRARRSAGSG